MGITLKGKSQNCKDANINLKTKLKKRTSLKRRKGKGNQVTEHT